MPPASTSGGMSSQAPQGFVILKCQSAEERENGLDFIGMSRINLLCWAMAIDR